VNTLLLQLDVIEHGPFAERDLGDGVGEVAAVADVAFDHGYMRILANNDEST
jgi:hypothetical protein